MCIFYPESFNTDMKEFFSILFGGQFLRLEPTDHSKKIIYYNNFDSIGISIIVTLPLYVNAYDKFDLDSSRKIKIVSNIIGKDTPPYLIEMKDISMYGKWRMRLKERVTILLELMQTQTHTCPKCHIPRIPKAYENRQDEKCVQFVALYCSKCHSYSPIDRKTGLQTLLHKNLRKRRS
ncbi:MAG: hypothetical protein ACKUBY_03230 [Candidatus Moraniibacteriota bacterium]|jgi:hypothetical protein